MKVGVCDIIFSYGWWKLMQPFLKASACNTVFDGISGILSSKLIFDDIKLHCLMMTRIERTGSSVLTTEGESSS